MLNDYSLGLFIIYVRGAGKMGVGLVRKFYVAQEGAM